jgi:ribonuclease Z
LKSSDKLLKTSTFIFPNLSRAAQARQARSIFVKIVILGTSGAVPSETAHLPAIMLLYEGQQVLFDAGEDVQGQFLRANLKFNAPLVVCISHLHGDHVIGLPGLLFNFHMGDRTAPLTIIGPPGILTFLCHLREDVGLRVECPLEVREIAPDLASMAITTDLALPTAKIVGVGNDRVVFENALFAIKVHLAQHSTLTLAYCFAEHPLLGKFHPDVATEQGIPKGRQWKQLQQGQPVQMNGTTIDPVALGIVEPPQQGRTIVYTGDTAPGPAFEELCPAPDVLIHESMYLNEHADLAAEKMHSTAEDAARVAARCHARFLILTHRSSRYRDHAAFLEETRDIFPGAILANELDVYELKKDHCLQKLPPSENSNQEKV